MVIYPVLSELSRLTSNRHRIHGRRMFEPVYVEKTHSWSTSRDCLFVVVAIALVLWLRLIRRAAGFQSGVPVPTTLRDKNLGCTSIQIRPLLLSQWLGTAGSSFFQCPRCRDYCGLLMKICYATHSISEDLRQTYLRECLGAWPSGGYFGRRAGVDCGSGSSDIRLDTRSNHWGLVGL